MSATKKAFLSGWNCKQFTPIYTSIYNSGSPRQNATYLITALLGFSLRLALNTTAGQNTCSVFHSCRPSVTATGGRVLAFTPRSTIINTALVFWLGEGHHVVQTVGWDHRCTSWAWSLKYRNSISVSSPLFQNVQHYHVQSLKLD
jgi:hypothetical protein